MRFLILGFMMVWTLTLCAKTPDSDKILQEGKLLYRLEKGSWYGTDDFLARFPDLRNSIGGYLSYENDEGQIITIFFDRNDNFKIIARYQFESVPGIKPLSVDTVDDKSTQKERDLITIRQKTYEEISNNSDGFFSFYENTSFNVIPLISKGVRKTYVLTGPKTSGVVIIGNDYELKFNQYNKLVKKKKIHASILEYPYKSDNPENSMKSTYHSHVLSDAINTTDICTLLLYKDYVEWKQHIVLGKKFVSILDLEKVTLAIVPRKVWEKLNKLATK
ncbi:hypothetical protein EYV94_20785 [Puteibacter caeruleilacunae]|nr:hypothetical protein EYV94_20785 [Puteibacter caeruleilacunae]